MTSTQVTAHDAASSGAAGATTSDIPAGIEAPRTGVPGMLAALDLGTNSFHLVVARIRGEGYEIVTREKQTIRLGHGGGDMKELSSDAMERGMVALRRMKRIADSHGAPVRHN